MRWVHQRPAGRRHAGGVLRRRFALLYAAVMAVGLFTAGAVVVTRPTLAEAVAKMPGPAPTTTTTAAPLPPRPPKAATRLATLDVRVSGVELLRAGAGPAELPATVRDKVVGVVTSYVQRATVAPLTSGRPADGVRELFTGGAEAQLLSGDRATLVDEGLPPARPVGRPAAELRLTALAGRAGAVELVTVGLLVEVRAVTVDGRAVQVNRLGELTLAPVGGRWRVESYALAVDRTVEGEA